MSTDAFRLFILMLTLIGSMPFFWRISLVLSCVTPMWIQTLDLIAPLSSFPHSVQPISGVSRSKCYIV